MCLALAFVMCVFILTNIVKNYLCVCTNTTIILRVTGNKLKEII